MVSDVGKDMAFYVSGPVNDEWTFYSFPASLCGEYHCGAMIAAYLLPLLLLPITSQQVPQAKQAPAVKQQDKTTKDAAKGTQPQQPSAPTKITIDDAITVKNQPDPKQEQRDAEQRAQTRFENSVQVWTLVFVAVAALGAIGAYLANRREARAAEKQVGIMGDQLKHDRDKFNTTMRPYLDVEGVRISDSSLSPIVFFVQIANHGPVQANDVRVSIEVDYRTGSTATYSGGPHTVNIPANSSREHFIASGFTLNDEMLDQLERRDAPLVVSGVVSHEQTNYSEKYCYKWYAWPHAGNRPKGLPLFVPCEFNKARAFGLRASGAMKFGSSAKLTGEKNDPPQEKED